MLNALSLPHAIPLKAPWIVSTSDREYIVCPPLRVLSVLSKFFGSKGDLKDFFRNYHCNRFTCICVYVCV